MYRYANAAIVVTRHWDWRSPRTSRPTKVFTVLLPRGEGWTSPPLFSQSISLMRAMGSSRLEVLFQTSARRTSILHCHHRIEDASSTREVDVIAFARLCLRIVACHGSDKADSRMAKPKAISTHACSHMCTHPEAANAQVADEVGQQSSMGVCNATRGVGTGNVSTDDRLILFPSL